MAELGLAMLRKTHPAQPNAVVSPLAATAALGLVHTGVAGAAEREIEALFGAATGHLALRQQLPQLLRDLQKPDADKNALLVLASRVWIDPSAAPAVPRATVQRLQKRWQADAKQVSFADAEPTREQINQWTATHTRGRVAELLGPGSVTPSTRLALTTALHFKSPWEKPFDATQTEPRAFRNSSGVSTQVPTLNDERGVHQATVEGTTVMALPFAGNAYTLLLAMPAQGGSTDTMLKAMKGDTMARWRAALLPKLCAFALPKFNIAPLAASIKPSLQQLGVKTLFSPQADLRPLLGRQARGAVVDDVMHAAGMAIDEQGGEAVAAAAVTVRAKSLAVPLPACAVDRAFVFAVMHSATGVPVVMGKVDALD